MWNKKAEFWDNLHGDEGNAFHRVLVSPSVERLLQLHTGEHVLDIGCGSGVLARRLSELGGRVTAVDFSEGLIQRAQARGTKGAYPIDYRVVDATDEQALRALGEGQFDAITCTMALMDMPVIAPLYRAVRALLKPGGRFVFATMHPAFNSNHPVFMMESGDDNGEIYTRLAIKISAYLDIPPVKGAGAIGEPSPHYYYHRPLHALLSPAFEAGLVLDAIEEPAFPEQQGEPLRLSWKSYPQIPPVLTARLTVKEA